MNRIVFNFTILFASLLLGCGAPDTDQPAGTNGWLKGSSHEKFETVATQLRGFDVAMVETGYRYQELYWAGQDQNWDYAKYQLDKIKLAMENGFVRRPKRAKSAEVFMNEVLPAMQKAVAAKDTAVFAKNFQTLTANCNACHAMEKLPFFTVKEPTESISPIRK